jgi:hypothetical protein
MVAALVFLMLSLVGLIWGIQTTLDQPTLYDCRIAEISPDFTPAMKTECRNKQKESTQ